MTEEQKRRRTFRRYGDRRITALLELHEVLFYEPFGLDKTDNFFGQIASDFVVDRIALVQLSEEQSNFETSGIYFLGDWNSAPLRSNFNGAGIQKLVSTHADFDGALTLSKFRTSSLFTVDEWTSLWQEELVKPASALLSVKITPQNSPPLLLWLIMDAGSREWSSHDRDLSEEEALLLAKILDKKLLEF